MGGSRLSSLQSFDLLLQSHFHLTYICILYSCIHVKFLYICNMRIVKCLDIVPGLNWGSGPRICNLLWELIFDLHLQSHFGSAWFINVHSISLNNCIHVYVKHICIQVYIFHCIALKVEGGHGWGFAIFRESLTAALAAATSNPTAFIKCQIFIM